MKHVIFEMIVRERKEKWTLVVAMLLFVRIKHCEPKKTPHKNDFQAGFDVICMGPVSSIRICDLLKIVLDLFSKKTLCPPFANSTLFSSGN